MFRNCLILFSCLLCTSSLHAKGVYQQPDEFVEQSFNHSAPLPEVIWLNDALKQQLENILQHRYQGRRIRYWRVGQRSLWILEEIGKKKPSEAEDQPQHQCRGKSRAPQTSER